MKNNAVKNYQKSLNEKYGAGLSEDGAWGEKTQAAYEQFILKKAPAKNPLIAYTDSAKNFKDTVLDKVPEKVAKIPARAELYKKSDADNTSISKKAFPSIGSKDSGKGSLLPKRPLSVVGNSATLSGTQFLKEFVNSKLDKEVFDLTIDRDDLTNSNKKALYKLVDQTVKKTGKNKGSITFDDYGTPKEAAEIKKHSKGEKGLFKSALKSLVDPKLDIAMSLGSFNYNKDPETGNIRVTDSYDFLSKGNTEGGKLKKDWVADAVRNKSDNTRKFFAAHDRFTDYDTRAFKGGHAKNRKVAISLKPSDTTSLLKKI